MVTAFLTLRGPESWKQNETFVHLLVMILFFRILICLKNLMLRKQGRICKCNSQQAGLRLTLFLLILLRLVLDGVACIKWSDSKRDRQRGVSQTLDPGDSCLSK